MIQVYKMVTKLFSSIQNIIVPMAEHITRSNTRKIK